MCALQYTVLPRAMSSPLVLLAVFDSATFPDSMEPVVPAPVWGQAEQLKGQMQGGEEG